MRVGVAGIPGAWSTERMAESLRAQDIEAFTFALSDTVHDLARQRVTHGADVLNKLDGVVVKKLGDQSDGAVRARLMPLREIERSGVRIFSRVDTIDRAMDRYRMTMDLVACGLPVPETFAIASHDGLRDAVASMGESVVKPLYTSKGRGMFRVTPESVDGVECDGERIVQRYVESPGRDIGATVIGGTFVGAFYRVAQDGEWQTTTGQGGRYEPCTLSAHGIELAEQAARVFGLDYTVVDLVEQGDDFLIYEVSAFGGFRGLFDACGVDPSMAYAAHVRRELAG